MMRNKNKLIIIALSVLCLFVYSEKKNNDISNLEYIDGIYIPKNLHETWSELEKIFSKKDHLKISIMKDENEMGTFHRLGMGLRNRWGLWHGSRLAKYFNKIGVFHPDDMSGIIIDAYWCHVHILPIRLEERIEYYKLYWLANSEPKPEKYPERGILWVMSQNYDTEKGENLGCIHIFVNKELKKVWLYEYDKGWKVADKKFLKENSRLKKYFKE